MLESFPQDIITAQVTWNVTAMGLCIVEFIEQFQDITSIEKDTFWFFLLPLTPSTLKMLRINCSWSSLNCSVTMSVTASTNNSNWLNFYRQLDEGSFPVMWIFTMWVDLKTSASTDCIPANSKDLLDNTVVLVSDKKAQMEQKVYHIRLMSREVQKKKHELISGIRCC